MERPTDPSGAEPARPWWLRGSPRVAALALLAYAVGSPLAVDMVGPGLGALALLPTVLAGLGWGPLGGLVTALAVIAYNIGVMLLDIGPDETAEMYRAGGTIGSLVVLGGGVAAGYLRNVQLRVLREVSTRRAAQRDLEAALAVERSLRAELEQQDAMKNLFLRAVGHDLRTPLVPIVSGVELLRTRRSELDDATRARLLEAMQRHARTLQRQMEALLDVDRLTSGNITPEPHPTDVQELLKATAETVVPATRTVAVHSSVGTVEVDPHLLERILENLLGNAVKHTAEDVPLRLTATMTDDGLLVSLEQTGAAVDGALTGRLFNAYQRGAGATTAGHGLGLSLVAGFADLHGGRAWLDGSPDGAVFRVLLGPLP